MVALANKNILPTINLPGFGNINFLSNHLKYNYKILFFQSPISLFYNSYSIQEKYKKFPTSSSHYSKHTDDLPGASNLNLINEFERRISILALINLICMPFIFFWQLIYTFFTYVEMAKREPDVFGKRKFTEYSKLQFRHFNELEHEFNSRLARAHRPATKYLNSFQSYLLIILAEHLSYIFGAILAVLIALTIYDEDVLKIEHALTVMGLLTAIVGILRGLIPSDEELNCPKQLLNAVQLHLHYLPNTWYNYEHTDKVRSQFDKKFQLKIYFIIEELLSPLITPYFLYFKLRPRSYQILEFFKNHTTTIPDVGDVCSLATMDLVKSKTLSSSSKSNPSPVNFDESITEIKQRIKQEIASPLSSPNSRYQAKDSKKIEMSLIHFKAVNKNWQPPNQKTQDWLNKNFNDQYPRNISEEPEIEELMGSKNSYNFLAEHDNFGKINSSRDFGREADDILRMNMMNSSIMKLSQKTPKSGQEIRHRNYSTSHAFPATPSKNSVPLTGRMRNNSSTLGSSPTQGQNFYQNSSTTQPQQPQHHHQMFNHQMNAPKRPTNNYMQPSYNSNLFEDSQIETGFRYQTDEMQESKM